MEDDNDLCHGGMGLTTREVLSKVYKKNNSLPYNNNPNPGIENGIAEYEVWWWLNVLLGEMQFPNSFVDLGYNIKMFDKTKEHLIYTYKEESTR